MSTDAKVAIAIFVVATIGLGSASLRGRDALAEWRAGRDHRR